MALPELQQAQKIIDRATRVLLIVPAKPSRDAVASMIALYLALQNKKEDAVDEVSASHLPTQLQFLPGSSQVAMAPQKQTEVILDLAGPQNIADIRQEPLQGGIRLHVSLPENTTLTKSDIEASVRPLPYDAAIVIGAADLEDLGSLFTEYTDFFYNTPIINIDHRADNEHFGTVNLVDITAGSCAEVATELIDTLQPNELDRDIATALYAGIIAGTDSFQRPSTTPRSFQVAARLMEHDADREAVIQNLIKTKPLKLLKLSGRIYARLRYDEYVKLFWSIIRTLDFQDSGATVDDLPAALQELTNNIAAYNAAFLLYEYQNVFALHLVLGPGLQQRRDEIQSQLSATRDNGLLKVTLTSTSLDEAEAEALEKVRAILP